jgi:EAL domain-containing protein (putative c-di-GMP-specific phosphodiesterase class I)/CHASE2 domain-containing sensor protein
MSALGAIIRQHAWTLLSGLIALGCAVLALSGQLRPIENAALDLRFGALPRPASGEVVIIEIDAKSLRRLDHWPWPRHYHAEAIDRLSVAGASLVAFDVDFSDFSAAQARDDDARLAASAEASRATLILAAFRHTESANNGPLIDTTPFEALRGHAFMASANVEPDPDGQVRRYPAATRIAGAMRPSLASLVADTAVPFAGTYFIDYGIQLDTIPHYSFVDLLDGRVPSAALKGKRILIGASAVELGDRYAVPGYGLISGVAVQALAAETLLQKHALWRVDPRVSAGFAAMAVFMLAGCRKRLLAFAALAATFPFLVVLGALGVQAELGLLLDIMPPLVAWLATCIALLAVEVRARFSKAKLHDTLSRLPNRLKMLGDADSPVNAPRIVVTARILRFEKITAAFGIGEATRLIIAAGQRLRDASAATDVYRLTDDTFGMLLPARGENDVAALARAIETACRDGIAIGGARVDVAFCIGAADRIGDAATDLDRALSALETAGRAGQSWSWCEGRRASDGRWEVGLGTALRSAIASGNLELAFQPKLALRSGAVTRAEVLVRWNDPVRGAIQPESFVPAAEANGSIRDLTRFVLAASIARIAEWQREGLDVALSVNISTVDLVHPTFVGEVLEAVRQGGIRPADLTLEITESAALGSDDSALANAMLLKQHGFRLSIDDYGAGQSTLTYVRKFPISEIKIDKSFVLKMSSEPANRILVRSTIELAHALGCKAVAEGVETQAVLDELAIMGCDYAQGYLIGKPMSAGAFAQMLRRESNSAQRVA